MAKNDESPKLQLGRSHGKSPSRQRNTDRPRPQKSLPLNLESDSPRSLGDKQQQSKGEYGESSSVFSPSPKKRKRNDDQPEEGLDEMLEEEIQKQWDIKAEKNNLTVLNVKNILKSVITNKYVVDMVRQTIEKGNFTDNPFEPKFTRAKKKELLQQLPGAPLPPVVGLLTPLKPPPPDIDPEMKRLMAVDLHEDSSDEEYNPDNEVVEQSDDDESRGETSFLSDADSMPPTPSSLPAPPTPSQDISQDGSFKVPQENVGQRTRSKLDLNRLAVESLEQMFVPPDIPDDMYEEECDNPDWQEFLQDFAQPMCLNETLEDDVENDPEYNILADEVKLKVDKEEMRKDKAVKVTRKELNVLMKELFEYTDMAASDNDLDQTTESLAELEASIMQETEDRQRREELEMENLRILEEIKKQEELMRKKKERRGMVPTQILLLAQQMRQHVQLTTQHFLQTYKHPTYHYYSGICRTMLTTLNGLTADKVFQQPIDNLESAVETVLKWEELHNHPDTGEKIRKFVKEQIALEKVKRQRKQNTHMIFPEELMQTAVESEAFVYPSLLPSAPFRTTFNMAGPNSFTHSEDMLIAISLEQVTKLMEERKRKYKQRRLIDKAALIYNASLPRCSPKHIARRISRQTCSNTMNPIKSYMDAGEVPTIVHCVTRFQERLKLSHRPLQHFPETWRTFLINANKEPSSSEAAGTSTSISSTSKNSAKTKTLSHTNQHSSKSQEPSQDLTSKHSSKSQQPSQDPTSQHSSKSQEPSQDLTPKHSSKNQETSQDLTVKSSSTINSSPNKTSADRLKSSEKGMHRSEKSNSGAKLPCTAVCSNNSSFKKSSTSNMDAKSSKPFENRNTNTDSTINKSPVKSNNCKKPSSNMNYLKCNGRISLSVSNKRDKRKYTKKSHPVKCNNTSGNVKLVDIITNCNTGKIVSTCKVQSAMIVSEQKDSSLGSNLLKKGNLLNTDVQNSLRSIVKTQTNNDEIFTKSSPTPVAADKLSLKSSKSPKKRRDSKKKVSFHLASLKKDSAKCDRPEENIKTQSHPPKVRFSVKFQDNTLGSHVKQSNDKLVVNVTSFTPNFLKKSGSGLVQNCHETAVEHKVSKTSEDHNHKTKICNSVLYSSISPTKMISHSPKPPSTVKLKKV